MVEVERDEHVLDPRHGLIQSDRRVAEPLEADPASCEALWGASKLELDAGALGDEGKRRLDAYAKLCPRGAHAAEAARLSGAR